MSPDSSELAPDLVSWLTAELGLADPVRIDRIAGGWSNLTSLVTDRDGRQVVVRCPPTRHVGGGAHDVIREARICSALRVTSVPAPLVLATGDHPAVLPTPCYVMAVVPGEVLGSAEAARRIAVADRRDLGFALIDLLVDLQAVDLDAVGLSDLRRNTAYLPRQLRRWRAQWRATSDRPLAAIDHVADRLEQETDRVAAESTPVLVHQDFRFGNVMIVSDPEPRISGLLDWELTTSGHPLADLGFLGARMHAPEGVLGSDRDPSAVEGYPDFAELVARFGARTGHATDDLPTFIALSAWRWAIIVEGIRQRISSGAMGEFGQSAQWHRRRVELLADFAADVLG
jgi:aminoglycoside phosphotransferase (APT) family kinase protein